jgi:hypothetical protein
MKPRHAAALALVGWYLMVAPQSKSWWTGAESYDDSAPLSRWTIESSFDSAARCETVIQAREHKAGEAIQNWAKAESSSPDGAPTASINEESRGNAANEIRQSDPDDEQGWAHAMDEGIRMDHARCIATDDPRLKGQ